MTMTLSSAAAAAQAARADLTAPVAANHGAAALANNSGRSTAVTAKPAASGNGNGTQNSSRSATSARGPAGNAGKTSAAPAGQPAPKPVQAATQQPERSSADAAAQAALAAASAAAPLAAPLFSQLLNLAEAAPVAKADEPAASDGNPPVADDATAGPSAAANSLLPAMITSMLSMTPAPTPAPAQAGPAAADSDSTRTDAISATSTLSASATRLNLTAASVAVTPAAAPAPAPVEGEATLAAANLAASNAAVASNVAVAAPRRATTESPAPAPVAADNAAPVADADNAMPMPPVVVARAQPSWAADAARGADSRSARYAATAVNTANMAAAGSADDGQRSLNASATSVSSLNISQGSPAAGTAAGSTVTLAGTPEQWQQPLRDALGDRLQLQLQRNNDHAVIRLEPPNMGSIEISIRHSAGALQVNLTASNSEVVRQLNTIGDSVRQDLSTKQFTDVAVTVSSSRAQSQADQGGQGGRNGQQRDESGRTPGRALSDDDSTATFAMTGE